MIKRFRTEIFLATVPILTGLQHKWVLLVNSAYFLIAFFHIITHVSFLSISGMKLRKKFI